MLSSRNLIATLSLSAALIVPNAASACNTPVHHSNSKAVVTSNHDKDEHENKSEKDGHSQTVTVKKVETEKVETKTDVKSVDKDDHKKLKTEKSDNDKKDDDSKTHKPTHVVIHTPGKGDANGAVLSAATTPVVKTAATLPVTGQGTDIALAVAAASAIAAFAVSKYRKLKQ